MKMLRLLALPTLVWGLVGCAPVQVDRNRAINFDAYKKYAWVKPDIQTGKNPLLNSSLSDANIRTAIEGEFAKRGLTRSDSQPDFYVMYHEYTQPETRTVANPTPTYPVYGYGPRAFYYGGRLIPMGYTYWYHPWSTGYHTEHFTEGTLIVDVIDARTNELIWRGSIENPVGDSARLGRQFAREAQEILKRYPEPRRTS